MRVLFSTGSPAHYMLPPVLGDEQINCGPDWADVRDADGRVRSLRTPVGEYDLAAIAAQLPPEQQPDVVVCLVDSSWRNRPRNLAGLHCPRVALIADTHHQQSPLIGMMRYLSTEAYHRLVLLYDRHHASLFHAAGFQNLHWFPGLTFPHSDATVKAARVAPAAREARIAFVGQVGKFHPRRVRLVAALTQAKVPVAVKPLPQAEGLNYYGASLLGFNASLNGDLNLRVFEILASGAALLTDRLAPEAGLEKLFSGHLPLATYDSPEELALIAQQRLANPAGTRALGESGAQWFDTHFNEAARRAAFQTLAFENASPALFDFEPGERSRTYFNGDIDRLLQGVMVYEGLQELHRTQETVRAALDPQSGLNDFAAMCATLPRLKVVPAGPADLAAFNGARAADVSVTEATRLWCADAGPDDHGALTHHFSQLGFVPVSRDVAVFCRPDQAPVPADPVKQSAAQMVQARALFDRGEYNAAFQLARTALDNDPKSADARVLLGELSLLKDGPALAEKLFHQAAELRPGDMRVHALLADAMRVQRKFGAAGVMLTRLLRTNSHALPLLLALARLRIAEKQPATAEAALREAVEYHPRSVEAARALGDQLKRMGQSLEALTWQRHALGYTDRVPPIDLALGPVRVVFVMQNPQGWTSLESVWRALAEDPQFSTTIVAAPYQHAYPPEGGPEAIYGFLTKRGIPFVRWDEFEFGPGFADIVFLQNPYDVTRPEPLHVANLLRFVPRLAYVPYALEIGGGDENATLQLNLPLQQHAWAVFARSPRHKATFAAHCAVGDAHVIVTGHPKMDALRGLATAHDAELSAFVAGRKMVVWNPQFDVRPDGSPFGTGYSTFLRWQKFLPAEFARRQDLAFVIRPHPLFFGSLLKRQILTQAEIDAFVARCAAAGNIHLDRRPSYLPVFAASTALITDASSFVLEYGATGKPLCYLHNPTGPGLNADGEFVRRYCAMAETEGEIGRFLDDVAAGRDPQGEARRKAFPEYMHLPAAGVGETIRQAILSRLKAEANVPIKEAAVA